ncbi:MAG: MATE family efflux transporter [Eubacteriales bacterium]
MERVKKKNQIDMTVGSILGKQILFIVPLMFTTLLQLLYNAVDIIVVGKFAGTTALSAVGSTGALINLLINVFMGLSIGASVVTSLYFGSKDEENMHRTIHTSVAIAIIAGLALAVIGQIASPILLRWMATPDDVINQSVLYMRIIFIGMPFNLLYNFCAAILRAVGDTKRPLIFLGIAGVVNVVLNLIFVIIFHMDVAGVATATIIAQAISVILITRCLTRSEGALKLTWSKVRIYKGQLIRIVQIGLPAGIQGSFFSISNVLIQSSINSFGAIAMAGNAASANLESFIFAGMNCVHQSAVTFAGQNLGAREYRRVRKNLYYCWGLVMVIAMIMCTIFTIFAKPLVCLYTNDAEAIAVGVNRLIFFCRFYFLCGAMDVIVGHVRGIGHSLVPMFISLLGVCVFRVVWVFFVFSKWPTLDMLYISYPVTWILCIVSLFVYYLVIAKKEIAD